MTDAKDAPSRHPLAALWAPSTIRTRCADVLRSVENNASAHFKLDRSRLSEVAERVAAALRRERPDLRFPPSGCWSQFDAGGVPRWAELNARLAGRSPAEVARAQIDLTVLTALLGTETGRAWRYSDSAAVSSQALPAQRQNRDDLLAQLDLAAAGKQVAETPAEAPVAASGAAPVAQHNSAHIAPPEAQHNTSAAPPAASLQHADGLAVATLRAFMAGAFSAHSDNPLRADAQVLAMIDPSALRAILQAHPSNPLLGLEGRASVLARLGQTLLKDSNTRGLLARPCGYFEPLMADHSITASALLKHSLRCLGPVWAGSTRVLGLPAGDVGAHLWAGAGTGDADLDAAAGSSHENAATGGFVPFHQAAQWLCLSLAAMLQVTEQQALSGLPNMASAGLFIDAGVLLPRQATSLGRTWKVTDEWVVEWRALTVMLLDEVAGLVRQNLDQTAQQLPLAAIQQWGCDVAGRTLAVERRPGGAALVGIDSDGSLF